MADDTPRNDPKAVVGDVLPAKDKPASRSRKGVGGCYSHGPLCKCFPCAARHRKQEALAIAAGIGSYTLAETEAPVGGRRHRNGTPRSLRDRIAQYLHYSMVFPDLPKQAIAEKMGITSSTLNKLLRDGQSHGILTFTDPLDRIDYEIIPKIVENLNYFLDAKDKTVTIEAAKGTLFRAYQDAKGISDGATTVLALKIEQPEPGSDVKVIAGKIVGKPKSGGLEDPLIIDLDS